MPQDDLRDPLAVEADRRKREGDRDEEGNPADEGPSVAGMASTHGTVFAGSDEEAEALASDETDGGVGTHDGTGRPRPLQSGG